MRNALLYLAVPLILLYTLGGSEALIEALSKIVILTGVQLVTRYLDHRSNERKSLNRAKRSRLKE